MEPPYIIVNLTYKLLTILVVSLACLLAGELSIRAFVELPDLRRLEDRSDAKDVSRVRLFLQHQIDNFGVTATEYGVWDDTYAAAALDSEDPTFAEYITSNYSEVNHESLRLNGAVLLNAAGTVKLNTAYDLVDHRFTPGEELDPGSLAPKALHTPVRIASLSLVDAGLIKTGLSNSNVGPIIYAASEILPSVPPYPESRGTLIFWRRVDSRLIDSLGTSTGASLKFVPFAEALADPEYTARARDLVRDVSVDQLGRNGGDKLTWLLRDVAGAPLFIVEQDAVARAYDDTLFPLKFAVGFGISAIVLLVAGLLFARSIIRRLRYAEVIMGDIVRTGGFEKRLEKSGARDEIETLFDRFNQMLSYIQSQDDELKARNVHLEKMTEQDALTAIPNRRYLDRILPLCERQCARSHAPLSVLMIDVDCFKVYNDRYGHAEGDMALRQVAQTLKGNLHRATDHLARYGGEEFSVILVDTNFGDAMQVAERLRRAVYELQIRNDFSTCDSVITVSIGVATAFPERPGFETNLASLADAALYRAKASGRNQVHGDDLSNTRTDSLKTA